MTTTIEQIRNDLKTLRLYYSAQAQLDKAFTFIPHCTTELVKTYFGDDRQSAAGTVYALYGTIRQRQHAGIRSGTDGILYGVYPHEEQTASGVFLPTAE